MFNLRNLRPWLVFVILLLTMVYILEPPSTTAAENQVPSQALEPRPKTLNAVQEAPDNLLPFNGNATVKLERSVEINDFGIILINDSYHLWNNRTDSARFNTLNVSYPSDLFKDATRFTFAGGRFNISSGDQEMNMTDISYQIFPPRKSNLTDVRIFFPYMNSEFLNVSKNDELQFYIMYAFDQRITVRRDDRDQRFTYNETLTPLLNFNATFQTKINVPSVAAIKNETIAFNLPLNQTNLPQNQTMIHSANYTMESTKLTIENVSLADLGAIERIFNETAVTNQTTPFPLPRVSFEYSSSRPLATCLENERTIRIIPWGSLLIKERFLIQVEGAESIGTKGLYGLEKVQLTIPLNASDIEGYDALGNLTLDETTADYYNKLDVNFRNKVQGNSTYEFYVSYRVPLETYLTVNEEDNLLNLDLPIANGFNWTIHELTHHIILPEGGTFVLPENESLLEIVTEIPDSQANMTILEIYKERGFGSLVQREVMTIKGQNLFEYQNGKITVVYRSSSLALLQIPLTISTLLFVLGVIYIGLHRVRIGVAPTYVLEREIPITLLETFVTTYDDKTALEERLRRLDERLRRKRITRTAFQHEKRVLDRELRQAEAKVSTLKGQLREEGRRYRDMIEELEINETEKVSILNSAEELKERRRKGRISREVFERLQREYARRLQRTTNQIDKTLVELREEIELGSRK